MQREFMDHLASLSKDAVKPSLSYYNLVARVLETCTRNNLELVNHCMTNSVKQFQVVSNTRKFDDIAVVQSQLASEIGSRVLGCVKSNIEACQQAANEFNKLIEETIHQSIKDAGKKPVNSKVDA